MIRPRSCWALPATALALALATPARADSRLVERLYDPDKVVRIEGRPNVQATIAFAQDEHIENVAIGDSNAWQVTPNKRANLLFVKPLAPRAQTNMTVVTDRHTYLFELVASPAARPLYVLRFTYPQVPKPAAPVDPAGLSASEALTATRPGAVKDPAQLNFAWKGSGKPGLLPARAYDDGDSTFLAWAVGRPIPAILVKDDKGVEGPVNFAVRGDIIVVDGVPALIVLRSGRDMATLQNTKRVAAPVAMARASEQR